LGLVLGVVAGVWGRFAGSEASGAASRGRSLGVCWESGVRDGREAARDEGAPSALALRAIFRRWFGGRWVWYRCGLVCALLATG
jgi:hypothetical protein